MLTLTPHCEPDTAETAPAECKPEARPSATIHYLRRPTTQARHVNAIDPDIFAGSCEGPSTAVPLAQPAPAFDIR